MPLSLSVRTERALRPERARGPPAGKTPRAPIRHGGRRRREREEKVSRAAAFCGLAFFCLRSPSVPPSLTRRAPPRSTSPSWRGGWESRAQLSAGLGSPPRTPAPRLRSPACPARSSGRAGRGRVRPSLPRLPAPDLRVCREHSAPGGPCARCQLPGVEAFRGRPRAPPSRLVAPGPPLPLYVREFLRGARRC